MSFYTSLQVTLGTPDSTHSVTLLQLEPWSSEARGTACRSCDLLLWPVMIYSTLILGQKQPLASSMRATDTWGVFEEPVLSLGLKSWPCFDIFFFLLPLSSIVIRVPQLSVL